MVVFWSRFFAWRCSSGNRARNPDRLASQGVPAILEMKVATVQAARLTGAMPTHCADGSRQSHLGRSAHRPRLTAQARYPRLSADGESLLPSQEPMVRPALIELERICSQPRPSPFLACDFVVAITVRFHVTDIFVVMEIESHRIFMAA